MNVCPSGRRASTEIPSATFSSTRPVGRITSLLVLVFATPVEMPDAQIEIRDRPSKLNGPLLSTEIGDRKAVDSSTAPRSLGSPDQLNMNGLSPMMAAVPCDTDPSRAVTTTSANPPSKAVGTTNVIWFAAIEINDAD